MAKYEAKIEPQNRNSLCKILSGKRRVGVSYKLTPTKNLKPVT
jgi:hypothetical protein